MNEPITTSANRVKASGYWCEDATAITQAAIDKFGYTWDQEIPIAWGFETLGLGNTILALGAVRPKFAKRAEVIVVRLMKQLYSIAARLGIGQGFTITDTAHWLGDPNRRGSRRATNAMWLSLGRDMVNPGQVAIANAMAVLFSEEPNHIACIHASKHILYADSQLHGPESAETLRTEIINFLREAINNG